MAVFAATSIGSMMLALSFLPVVCNIFHQPRLLLPVFLVPCLPHSAYTPSYPKHDKMFSNFLSTYGLSNLWEAVETGSDFQGHERELRVLQQLLDKRAPLAA